MSQTKAGALKAKATILKNNPNHYKDIGKKGGQMSTTGGFASQLKDSNGLTGAERAKLAGQKGGRKSRKSND